MHETSNEDYEEYIKYCIQNEENEKKEGYLDRIKGYKTLLIFIQKLIQLFIIDKENYLIF